MGVTPHARGVVERRGGDALRPTGGEISLLLRHEARRLRARVRRPEPGVWLGIGLPLALILGALWVAGEQAQPGLDEVEGAVLWGFVVTAPLAFVAYGVLFRPADDPLLRRLGLSPAALFVVRALRLVGLVLGVTLIAAVPFLATGAPLGRPLAITLGALLPAWALALLAFAGSAQAIARARAGQPPGFFSRLMQWDRELAAVGPLFYAPLAPLFGGVIGAGVVGAAVGAGWGRTALLAAGAAALAGAAIRPFTRALPRFAPQALEMTYAPPPEAGEMGLAPQRGLARLLPRRVALVRARDAAVVGRRFRWATGIIWPVALLSLVALARWGAEPAVRTWVLAAGALVLVAQGAAVIALGRLERARTRWVDRSLGLGWGVRWVGRWAFAFGLALWLTVPLGIFWGLWVPQAAGWAWILAGAATAAVAALASLVAAG